MTLSFRSVIGSLDTSRDSQIQSLVGAIKKLVDMYLKANDENLATNLESPCGWREVKVKERVAAGDDWYCNIVFQTLLRQRCSQEGTLDTRLDGSS